MQGLCCFDWFAGAYVVGCDGLVYVEFLPVDTCCFECFVIAYFAFYDLFIGCLKLVALFTLVGMFTRRLFG